MHTKWKFLVQLIRSFMVQLIAPSHSLPSMGAAGKVGILLAIMAALPRWSSTPSRDQVWLMASPSSCPLCLARAAASFLTWASATSMSAPKSLCNQGEKDDALALQASVEVRILRS